MQFLTSEHDAIFNIVGARGLPLFNELTNYVMNSTDSAHAKDSGVILFFLFCGVSQLSKYSGSLICQYRKLTR